MSVEKRKRPASSTTEPSLLTENSHEVLNSINTPFPRGGGSSVEPLDIKLASVEATNDVFDSLAKGTKQKRKKRKTKTEEPKKQAPRAESLSLAKLKVGTLILARVSHNKGNSLVMSLPNNLSGFVDFDDKDDLKPYTPGLWLRAIVTSVGEGTQKRLELSIDPELVNQTVFVQDDILPGISLQARVSSIEDHGAVLKFDEQIGAKYSGFIPTKEQNFTLSEDQIVLVHVKDVRKKVITATCKQNHPKLNTVHQQASLAPGTFVEAMVESRVPNGCTAVIFGHIETTIDFMHLPASIKEGTKVGARISFSSPQHGIGNDDRTLGLTCMPHTLELSAESNNSAFSVGQKLNEVRVVSLLPKIGILVDIGLERPAFVSWTRIQDEEPTLNLAQDPRYKPDTIHEARIVSYSSFDDVYYLSLQKSIFDQKYLDIDEVAVGDVVENAKIVKILPKGSLLLSLSGTISGIAPEFHLSDIKLTNPEARFKLNQKVAALVIDVDSENRKIKVTLKKSLINSDDPQLKDLGDCEAGTRSTGTVVSLSPKGAVVEFFGGLCGFLPAREMSESANVDPKKHFWLGQSVSVRVLKVDTFNKKLLLTCRSMKLSSDPDSGILVGQIVEGVIVEKSPHEILVDVNDDRLSLPLEHLADSRTQAVAKRKTVKVGHKIEVVVLEKSSTGALASMKNSFLEAAKESKIPNSVGDLVPGHNYAGFVKNVNEDIGTFVSLGNNLVGLISNPESLSLNMKVHESISVYVSNIKGDRFTLTTKANSTQAEYEMGDVVEAKITSIKATQLNVEVGSRQGRLDISELFDSISDIVDVRSPVSQFEKGQILQARVIGLHDVRNHRFLPLSHRKSTHSVLELTIKKSKLEKLDANITPEIGSKVLTFINNFAADSGFIWVNVSPTVRGRLSLVDLGTDIASLREAKKFYPIGSALECTVFQTSPHLSLSCVVDESRVCAIVRSVSPTHLMLTLPHNKSARVVATDALDEYKPLKDSFKENGLVECVILEESDSHLYASTRNSVVHLDSGMTVEHPVLESIDSLSAGDTVQGYVKNIADGGVFVQLSRQITGRVQISQLSDKFVKDWKSLYTVGDVVSAKVVSKSGKRLELSLKSNRGERRQPGLEDLEEGSIVPGVIQNTKEYGIFIKLDNGLHGLCHRSEVADQPIKDLSKIYKEGDRVKVKVLKVDTEKSQLSLGLKASYFLDESGSEDEKDESMSEAEESEDEEEIPQDWDEDQIELGDAHSGLSSDEDEEMDDGPGLDVGFDWSADVPAETQEVESDSESDGEAIRKKRTKKSTSFAQDETVNIQQRVPQSTQDFERLLVADPNSSSIWINYVAYHLQLNEIASGREVAQRALRTIDARMEEEKLNVWVALLNLECTFGTKETTDKVFREACQHMDSRVMHLKMATIYASSDKPEDAKRIYTTACKRFGSDDLEVWTAFGRHFYQQNLGDDARALLDRGIKQLTKRLHRDLAVQFAIMEFSLGDAERGRTLFEGLVSSYKKRIDLWVVYLDQEIKHEPLNRGRVEGLFHRLFESKLTMKQAKLFFKKWLQYEVDHGDTKGEDFVKSRAAQYVKEHNE